MCGFQVRKIWLSDKTPDKSRTSFTGHEAPTFVVVCRAIINF
jgi:hypothetical protein